MANLSKYLAEIFGTALLITLGCGVLANISLKKTKGEGGGVIVASSGWGIYGIIATPKL